MDDDKSFWLMVLSWLVIAMLGAVGLPLLFFYSKDTRVLELVKAGTPAAEAFCAVKMADRDAGLIAYCMTVVERRDQQ